MIPGAKLGDALAAGKFWRNESCKNKGRWLILRPQLAQRRLRVAVLCGGRKINWIKSEPPWAVEEGNSGDYPNHKNRNHRNTLVLWDPALTSLLKPQEHLFLFVLCSLTESDGLTLLGGFTWPQPGPLNLLPCCLVGLNRLSMDHAAIN